MSKINNNDNQEMTHQQTILLSELLIRVSALENALLAKGIINSMDISNETKKVVSKLSELMKENINILENSKKE